jgi:hypothetical protein
MLLQNQTSTSASRTRLPGASPLHLFIFFFSSSLALFSKDSLVISAS